MIIPTIHERCTMEESERNQRLTNYRYFRTESIQKKKINNEKASRFLIKSPSLKHHQNNQRTQVAGSRFPSRSPREGQISRPPLTRERWTEEDFAF